MLNIEIHGLPSNGEKGAHDLRCRISFLFQDTSYQEGMNVTVVDDLVYVQGTGHRIPFLRLFSDDDECLCETIKMLSQFRIGIECVRLASYLAPPDEPQPYKSYVDAAMEKRPHYMRVGMNYPK